MHIKSYNEQKSDLSFYRALTVFMALTIAILAYYGNGLRVDNIDKNKEVERLQPYEKAWLDFNKTHIPETCLERIPEIEAIYLEERK